MRIAVARDGNMVSEHFGHCEQFVLYDVEGTTIKKETVVDSPPHEPGVLPVFLQKQGANVVITGGMGRRAIDLLEMNGVKVVTGVTGGIKDVVDAYLAGTLVGTGGVCEHHGDHDCQHHG